jgi:hypothetical protein
METPAAKPHELVDSGGEAHRSVLFRSSLPVQGWNHTQAALSFRLTWVTAKLSAPSRGFLL